MMPAEVSERLWLHAASVVAAASVPARERDELTEELFGHLVERWRSLVDDGMDPTSATARAVSDFGSAQRIGPELTRTYRGRFWASTIGALLPAAEARPDRPLVAWWLAASMLVYGLLYLAGAWIALTTLSPFRAVVLGGASVAWAALVLIGWLALGRGQRWALHVAVVVNIAGVVSGLAQMATTPGLISASAIGSALLLLLALSTANELSAYVSTSPAISGRTASAMAGVMLVALASPVLGAELPDPTQADPGDLHISARMHCPDEVADGGTVSVNLRWDRTDLLPGGVANLRGYGDMLVLELPALAAISTYSYLVDVETGQRVAEPNAILPAGDELAARSDLTGPAMIAIEYDALVAGHDYLIVWGFDTLQSADPSIVQAVVAYHHLDRFVRSALVGCDGMVGDWWTNFRH